MTYELLHAELVTFIQSCNVGAIIEYPNSPKTHDRSSDEAHIDFHIEYEPSRTASIGLDGQVKVEGRVVLDYYMPDNEGTRSFYTTEGQISAHLRDVNYATLNGCIRLKPTTVTLNEHISFIHIPFTATFDK